MIFNPLLKFFHDGGFAFMVPLLALSILSLAVILERTYFLVKQVAGFKHTATALEGTQDIQSLMSAKQDSIMEKTVIGVILKEALFVFRKNAGNHSLEMTIEKHADKYTPLLVERLWLLRAIGHIAPLVGLTGTVVGLAMAFRGIAEAGLSQQNVAAGIAMALNTTIMGLVIALPTLFAEYCLRAYAQSHFQRIKAILDEAVFSFGEQK
jgi:biopolymer transport protein ExbB